MKTEELIKALSDDTTTEDISSEEKEEDKAILSESKDADVWRSERLRRLKLANDIVDDTLKDRGQDRDQRKEFADRIFNLIKWYLVGVFVLLFLSGAPFHFHLDNEIFIILLGTTTANVIGIFAFVARYLFHQKD